MNNKVYDIDDLIEEVCAGNIGSIDVKYLNKDLALALVDENKSEQLALLPSRIFTKKVINELYEMNYKSICYLPEDVYKNDRLVKFMMELDTDILDNITDIENRYDFFKELLKINNYILYSVKGKKFIDESKENILELIKIAPELLHLMISKVPSKDFLEAMDIIISSVKNGQISIETMQEQINLIGDVITEKGWRKIIDWVVETTNKGYSEVNILNMHPKILNVLEPKDLIPLIKNDIGILNFLKEENLRDKDVLNACFNDYRFNSIRKIGYASRCQVFEALASSLKNKDFSFEEFISGHERKIDGNLWSVFIRDNSFLNLCKESGVTINYSDFKTKDFSDDIEKILKSKNIRRKKVDDLELDEIVEEICSGNISSLKKSYLTMDVAKRLVEDGESAYLSFFPEEFFTLRVIKELENLSYDAAYNLPDALYQDIELMKKLVKINPDIVNYIENLDKDLDFFKELLAISPEIIDTRAGRKILNKKNAYELLKIAPSQVKHFYESLPERHWSEAIDIALSVNASPRDIRVSAANEKQVLAFVRKNLDYFNYFGSNLVGSLNVLTTCLKDKRLKFNFNDKTKKNISERLKESFKNETFTFKQFMAKYKGEVDKDLWDIFQNSSSFIKLCAKTGIDPTNVTSEYDQHIREMFLVEKIKKSKPAVVSSKETVSKRKI